MWVDASEQKAYCKALLPAGAGASCGQASMEPRVVAMRFRDGPDKIEHVVYGGEMKEESILTWMTAGA